MALRQSWATSSIQQESSAIRWLGPCLPCLGDRSERQISGDGTAVAPVLRLAPRHQWPVLHGLCAADQPACHARRLAPTGKDLRGIGKAVKDHIVLRHPKGDEAKRYNVLQKLAYVGVLFVVAPLIILTGLYNVANDRYGVPLAAHDLRWTAGGRGPFTLSPVFPSSALSSFTYCSNPDGILQQHPFHGDRMVCCEA